MKPWLFISDLHLSPERPDIIDSFLRFCAEVAPTSERLYILGDFVEYWIGDDYEPEAIQPAFDALKWLADSGIDVYFMVGNRDFLIGEQLASRYHFSIIVDPLLITYADESILLMHGDSLCTDDTEYQNFRNMVRDPDWQQAFLSKPVAERDAIANSVRETSKLANSGKDEYIMDVNQAAVETMMREQDTHLLIHGHTHRPAIHEFELDSDTARRVVLPDWYESGGYLMLDGLGELKLTKFSI